MKIAALALLVLSAGCTVLPDLPFAPGDPSTPEPSPEATDSFPPLRGPGRIYTFSRALMDWGFSPNDTRYVLYDDGTFAYQRMWSHEFVGPYQVQAGDTLILQFGDQSAKGSLSGDTLTVRYGALMNLSDWMDAVYLSER